MPLVSVVTPLYNSSATIEKTIASVFSQTFKDWEMIVVDDCSSDGSYDLAKKYSSCDSRVKVLQLNENSGAAVARNTAIEHAEGRYVAFLDSDDLWLPKKLETQVSFMQGTGVSLSYSGYEKIDEFGVKIGEVVSPPLILSYRDMLKSNQIGCLTAMYDTERVGKVYMPLIRKRQDYGLWLKILKSSGSAQGIKEPLALYRERPGSISSNKIKMLKYNWDLYREIEGFSFLKSAYYLSWNVSRKVFG